MVIFVKMFLRTIEQNLKKKLKPGKAIVLIGARQVGKTTLIKSILKDVDHLFLDADDPSVRALLTNPTTSELRSIIGKYTYIFIDEAQRIPSIGLTLKIITDQFPQVQLLVSGSSAFELNNIINEPLTGRKWEYELYPLSWQEFENKLGYVNAEQQLEDRLLYGFYPEVINNQGEEKETLKNIVNSYLYRDLLAFTEIRKPDFLEKLLQALAIQVGSEVNYNELAQLVGINKVTIQNYLDILERSFVIFRLPSFSRNLRNEIKQNRKVYFYDNGLRNMIIGNFSPLELRSDKGALWENFLMSERKKQNSYYQTFAKMYFWRTKQQQEIDYIEEKDGSLHAFEFKWKSLGAKLPTTFEKTYDSDFTLINRSNFRDFVKFDHESQ